jgi:hypothetical protein
MAANGCRGGARTTVAELRLAHDQPAMADEAALETTLSVRTDTSDADGDEDTATAVDVGRSPQLAQRPAHAKSPAFDSWRSLLTANGMPALALGGGRAVDDESLEKVRSKMWGNAFRKARVSAYEDDPWKDVVFPPAEEATRQRYDPKAGEWLPGELVDVKMGAERVDQGSIRECFRCKLRPRTGAERTESWERASKNHFAKRFLPERGIPEEAALDDVKLQMTAKYYAGEFNKWLPPKKIDFLECSVLQMHQRPGKPLYFLEHFISTGSFEKHNSNAGYVNKEHERNTPQVQHGMAWHPSNARTHARTPAGRPAAPHHTNPAIHGGILAACLPSLPVSHR